MKTLVLGLGNPILSDDGVGIHVVRAAENAAVHAVDWLEASVGGLRLLDALAGYDRVILVDAIQTAGGIPGDIHNLRFADLWASLHSGSSHDVSLPLALALGREIGLVLPDDKAVTVLGIEVDDVVTFGEQCTPAVARAIPRAVEAVLAELQAHA